MDTRADNGGAAKLRQGEALFGTHPGPIRMIQETGNSTSIGCRAAIGVAVHRTPPAGTEQSCFMFNPTRNATGTRGFGTAVLNGRLLTDFVPAYEQALEGRPPGETHGTALMAWLAWRRQALGLAPEPMLYRSHGSAGKMLTQVSKGAQPYANGCTEVERAVAIAGEYGKQLFCEDCFLTNGTQDRSHGVSRLDLKLQLDQLNADHNQDWPALTGQSQPIRLWLNQLSANNAPNPAMGTDIPLAHLDFVRSNPQGRMVGPRYLYEFEDVTHLTAERGYLWEGEHMARALFTELTTGRTWKALGQDIRVTRDGTHLDIVFDRGGLVFDETAMPKLPNFGFAVHGAAAELTLESVALASTASRDDTVRLTLSSTRVLEGATWSYAFNGPGSGARSASSRPGAGAWGNLRDSANDAPSRFFPGEYLRNWCVILKEPIPA